MAESATREGSLAQAIDLSEEPGLREVEPGASKPEEAANLTLRGITKRWRRNWDPVLDDIDFDLKPGELVWIGGRNGIGKTTLLRIIAGVITPDSGSIRLQGMDPERERRRYESRIGFLTAGNTGLIARLSTRYQLQFWAKLAFVPRSEREAAIERALTAFSLHELASKRVDRLSMGQRQRIRIAMVFLHSPDVVLLDEPLTSLDDEGAVLLSDAVREVTARGGSVVSCSPAADDQARLEFDRRCVIDTGRLLPA
jgi:heme ABC exporter ATP-binding subunit CcmA